MNRKDEESLSLSNELKKEKQQKKIIISEMDSLKKNLNEMKEEKLKQEKIIHENKKRLDELYYEKNEIQSELESKLQTCESNLKKEKEKSDVLNEKSSKLSEKISKLREEFKFKENQLIGKIDSLENDKDIIEQQLTDNKIKFDNTILSLEEQYKQELREKDVEIMKRDEKIRFTEECLNKANYELRTSENNMKETYDQQRKESKIQFDNEKTRLIEEIQEYRLKMENEQKERNNLHEEYSQKIKDLEESLALMEKKLKDLKIQYNDKDYELQQFKTKTSEVKQTVLLIQKKIKSINEILDYEK